MKSEDEFWEVFHQEWGKASLLSCYEKNAWSNMQSFVSKMLPRSNPVSRPLVGVGVFIKKDNKLLLGKRKGSHGAGEWSLPGGHLEFGESFETCCQREVAEETGLIIRNIRPCSFTNDIFPKDGKHYVTLFFTSEYESGELVNAEPEKCEGWEWFSSPPSPLFKPLERLLVQVYESVERNKSGA